jgi:hypothetical protein
MLPGPPELGPPVSYCHGIWIEARDGDPLKYKDEPVEYYDELDASRWSIRCVRKFRDGSLKACSYAHPNWRDEMPEASIPPVDEINKDPQFMAKEILKAEFEAVWTLATGAVTE